MIVNDNEMSIAENHGGLYGNLSALRASNGKAEDNYFKTLGFDYRYVADGNDVEALIAVLNEVKDSVRPVVVHVHTLKGKGYAPAEEHKEQFHWSLPFDLKTGQVTVNGGGKSYGEYVADYLEEQAVRNDKLAVINAATPGALMLRNFREKHPEKYFDVSPFELSGGQKRRAAIAGVVAMKPQVLILDEPTAGLDPKGRDEILDMVSEMHARYGITVILVSHSMEDVAKYVDRIIVMNHGQVRYDDTPREVFHHYKELEAIGLAAPQVTYLMHEMKEQGIDVSTEPTTVEEAKEAILRLIG